MERPAFILLFKPLIEDSRISRLDAEIYGYIFWLTQLRNERCTAGNDTLAKLAQTTVGTMKNSLANLESCGYIRRVFSQLPGSPRDEIVPLVVLRPSPTDDGSRHPQVTHPSPTGEQSKSIKEEHTIVATATDGDGDGGEKNTSKSVRQKKVTAEVQNLFDLFAHNPDRFMWKDRPVQRNAATVLIRELKGLPEVVRRFHIAQKHRGEEYCPSFDSPKKMLENMVAMEAFLKRNSL